MSLHTLITHSETFHCDEVMATAMLQYLYPNIKVIRTRDQSVLDMAKKDPHVCLIDVGQVYDPAKLCFDHHQKTFNDTFSEKHDILLSSCGLIYRHYGRTLVQSVLDSTICNGTTVDLEYIYLDFYNKFIYSIDAGDNGVDYAKEKKYFPIVLPVTVSLMNNDNINDYDTQNQCFQQAVALCREHMLIHLRKCISRSIKYNEEIVVFKQGLTETLPAIKNAGVLVLSKAINVRVYLNKYDKGQFFKYIVAPRDTTADTWNIWTVNREGSTFSTLAPLITQDEAILKYGRANVIFIHKNLFCGVSSNKETAINIALDSAKQYSNATYSSLCAYGLSVGTAAVILAGCVYVFNLTRYLR